MSGTENNYSVGLHCTGRIIKFAPNGAIVELHAGKVGLLRGVGADSGLGLGEIIGVRIDQIDQNGYIFLEKADANARKKPDEPVKSAEVRPWQGWQDLPAGHQQACTALLALRNYALAFRKELADAREKWENAKTHSQQVYGSVTASAQKQGEAERQRIADEYNKNMADMQTRRTKLTRVVSACESFIKDLPNGAYSAGEKVRPHLNALEKNKEVLLRTIDAKSVAYDKLRNAQCSEVDGRIKYNLDKARREQLDRDTQAERDFQAKQKQICEDRRRDIASGFNQATVHAYAQRINSSRFNAANYECPIVVPDAVMLGSIGLSIPIQVQDDIKVVQAIETQTLPFGTKDGSEYIVKIPYSQRLADGISLLARYAPADRNYVQSLMQPLLLKLFLSFPAGKLEATMIDPLELGASFSDIPKLAEGPNAARIIDTKVWSKERDIENAVAILRQRLENMTQSYGGDQESRLRKEVIRVLAVTDFPTGFNEAALKDLHAIVRNSAALGVCVLICANEEELEKLRQRHGTLLTEIAQSLMQAKANKNRLMLEGYADGSWLFLELDGMEDVLHRKDQILAQIRDGIEHVQSKTEHFASMFPFDIYDSNCWFTGPQDEVAIPLGIKGANTVVKMVLGRGGGSTEHHALITGLTGAGKSTLLHTLIMSTLISYSPKDVQMYLLDFKEGVEFSPYTRYRLPSLRVVAINSEREFGLSVLKELCTELEARTKHFTRCDVSDINGYMNKGEDPNIPRLLLIFDEVQELFRSKGESDSISAECLSCLNKLLMQGRAMGIHIILACQDFHNCAGLEAYFSQMAIRIPVKGSEAGAASILSADNEGIRSLQDKKQPAGAAIYNNGGGVESANNFFQVSYMEKKERLDLLAHLNAHFTDPIVADKHKDQQTRVLLTNAEDNIHNCFNQLIHAGAESIAPLGKAKDGYGLLLGQGFGRRSIFMPELCRKDRDNLLIVSQDEKLALALFELAAMSVLYEELHTTADKTNALVYIVDLFTEELTDDECDFAYFKECFSDQLEFTKIGEAEKLIRSLYRTTLDRSEGRAPCDERIFLLFFGINKARRLRTSKIYDADDPNDNLSPMEMLQVVLRNGPKYGINSIIWGESLHGIEYMLGDRCEDMFHKRIAYGLDDEAMDILVAETMGKSLRGKTAVYMDISTDVKNTHFRPYDIPAKAWIEDYAEAYKRYINEGGY